MLGIFLIIFIKTIANEYFHGGSALIGLRFTLQSLICWEALLSFLLPVGVSHRTGHMSAPSPTLGRETVEVGAPCAKINSDVWKHLDQDN